MEKITFIGRYFGLDARTGSLAIIPEQIRVESADKRGHRRTRDLNRDRAAKKIHELLGEGKSGKWIRITIEEVK